MLRSLCLPTAVLALLMGCGGGRTETIPDPPVDVCQGQICSHGRCVADGAQPRCECDAGYVLESGGCVAEVVDLCAQAPCTAPHQGACSVQADQVVCACDTGFIPSETGCVAPIPDECKNAEGSGDADASEPDNCADYAKPLALGESTLEGHSIAPAGDVDWFSLSLVRGHVYDLSATGAAGFVLLLDVFDAGGAPVTSDHFLGSTAEVRFRAPSTGVFRARLQPLSGSASFAYGVSFREVGLDDFEAVDPLAPALVPGVPVAGEYSYFGDVDALRYAVPARHQVSFQLSASFPVTLELVGEDGVVRTAVSGTAPVVQFYSATDTTVFVRGRTVSRRLTGAWTSTALDLGFDDHGDLPAFATVAGALPQSVSARFERAADSDVIAVASQVGHVYRALLKTGASSSCRLTFLDGEGAALSTAAADVSVLARDAVTFVRASSYYGSGFDCPFTISDEGLDDAPAGLDGAESITFEAGMARRVPVLEVSGDTDCYAIPAIEGHSYRMFATPPAGTAGSFTARLSDEAGRTSSASGGAYYGTALTPSLRAVRTSPVLGCLYGTGTTPLQKITVTFQDLGEDDYPDSAAAASAIAIPAYATSTYEAAGDVDAVAFEAEAGHIYVINTSTTADGSIQVVSPTGAQLVSTYYRQLSFRALASGRHAVLFSSTAYGTLSWSIEDLGVDTIGDTLASATPLSLPAQASGRIELSTDVDAFSFDGVGTHVYRLECAAPGCTARIRSPDRVSATETGTTLIFKVNVSGTQAVEILGTSATPLYSYSFTLADVGVDDFPDTNASSEPIAIGSSFAGALDFPTDVDVFRFTAEARHVYRVECGAPAALFNVVSLNGYSTFATNSAPALKREVAEVLYLRFAKGSSGTEPTTYSCQIVDLGLEDWPDAFLDAGVLATLPASVAGRLEVPYDVDVFAIDAVLGHIYQGTCVAAAGSSCSSLVRNDSTTLLYGTWPLESTANGKLYFEVRGSGDYTFRVEDLGVDDYADVASAATALAPGGQNGRLETGSDKDVFSVDVTPGRLVGFNCVSQTSAGSCSVRWVSATDVVLAYGQPRLTIEPTTDRVYVQVVGSGYPGSYTLTVEDLGVDDHGDTAETATPLPIGLPGLSSTLETSADVDAFSVVLQPRRVYELRGSPYTYGLALEPRLLPQGNSSAGGIVFLAPEAGTYTITRRPGYTTGSAQIWVLDQGLDDHGTIASEATAIPLGAWVTGTAFPGTDHDWFEVELAASTKYRVSVAGQVSGSVGVWVAGTLVRLQSGNPPLTFTTTTAGRYDVELTVSTSGTLPVGYQLIVEPAP